MENLSQASPWASLFSWTTLTLLASIPVIYWYFTAKFNYWRKRGLSGPKPTPIVGNSLDTLLTPMPIVERKWFAKFGRLYGTYDKERPLLTVAEPELIKQILVKDFHLFSDRKYRNVSASQHNPIASKNLFKAKGEDWKRLRTILSPTFTSGKMKKMYPMMRECLEEYLNHLQVFADKEATVNIKDMHYNLTMDVIATCAFATKTNSHSDPNNPFVVNAKKVLDFSVAKILAVLLLPKTVFKLLGINSVVDDSANQFFMDLTKHIVRQRKASNETDNKFNDFVQLMVDAEHMTDENTDTTDNNEDHYVNNGKEELEAEKVLSTNIGRRTLTEEEMMAQGWIFFIAGFETTATTLTFCSYELALNPDIQERLHEEVVGALDADGEISYETLSTLPYLDAVISETLRKYPPVCRIDRMSMTDGYKLGDTGLVLDKDQALEIPIYAIHNSEQFYPNPDKWSPDRFMPENRHLIKPYTYLPFGVGPRNCIGMRFGLMEAKLAMAHIVKRFQFFNNDETTSPLVFRPMVNLTSAKEVFVGIKARK